MPLASVRPYTTFVYFHPYEIFHEQTTLLIGLVQLTHLAE